MSEPSGPSGPSGSSGSSRSLLELGRSTAGAAAEVITRMRSAGVDVAATKSSDLDVVTVADRAAEELIRTTLLTARPDDAFMGEEGGSSGGASGVRWIVDPIDGTVNYLYGLPQYAVSIAAEVDGEVVAGVVLNAATGQEYVATRGGGASVDGRPLGVRDPVPISQRLVLTGFGYEAELRARQGAAVARMLPQVRDIRRLGSCALDLCALAAGLADAYVEEGVNLWDHAAAGLIAAEAGARLRISDTVLGKSLLVCAPETGFEAFATLVDQCGFGS